MIDPTSIGTALTTLAAIATLTIAFGLAAISDMAMRRREDRAAAAERSTSERPRRALHERTGLTAELPGGLRATEELAAHAPTGAVAANGQDPSRP